MWQLVYIQARGSGYEIGLTPARAAYARDGVAKAVYEAMYRWLLKTMNARLAPPADGHGRTPRGDGAAELGCIGLLDAFGFELLQTNSFEQVTT